MRSGIESDILNRIQRDIPITENPFSVIAEETGYGIADVLSCVQRLKKKKIVRDISGIFNQPMLGYRTALVAFDVQADQDTAAAEINAHPGVSHNYLRGHRYNIWFTISEESDDLLEKSIRYLYRKCRARDYIILKNEMQFKIGVFLKIESESSNGIPDDKFYETDAPSAHPAAVVTDEFKAAIRLLQIDIPVTERPFREITENSAHGMDEKKLIECGAVLKSGGIMRRYAAVLSHGNAGYAVNGLTVWKPDMNEIERIVPVFRSEQAVSHLYLRNTVPGKWEFPLFAMIHAKTDAEFNQTLRRIAERSGVAGHQTLRTLKEFKKQRVKYFSEEFQEWRHRVEEA